MVGHHIDLPILLFTIFAIQHTFTFSFNVNVVADLHCPMSTHWCHKSHLYKYDDVKVVTIAKTDEWYCIPGPKHWELLNGTLEDNADPDWWTQIFIEITHNCVSGDEFSVFHSQVDGFEAGRRHANVLFTRTLGDAQD